MAREIGVQAFDFTTQTTGGSGSQPIINTSIRDGRKTVATAGTREALSTPVASRLVTVTALSTNTGVVVVGGSTVIALQASRRGVPLNAGDSYEFEIDNLSKVFLDVTISGEGVTFAFFA